MKKLSKMQRLAFILPVMLSISIMAAQNAYAVKCTDINDHCYAYERFTGSTTVSGDKYTTIVPDIVTSTTCPNGEFAVSSDQWIVFANLDWMESGVFAGAGNGFCYTTEQRYYAYNSGVSYTEVGLGSAAIGSTQTFEIYDTDHDTFWDFYNNGVQKAHVPMISAYATRIDVGEETNHNTSTVPRTHIYDIQRFTGTPGSWSYWSSTSTTFQDTTFGLWWINCSPNYQHIHVGKGGTASCT